MKKLLLLVSIVIGVINQGKSQNYTLQNQDGVDITNTNVTVDVTADDLVYYTSKVYYYAKFINNTNSSKSINVKRKVIAAATGSQNLLCWSLCHDSLVNISNPVEVGALGRNDNFVCHYLPMKNFGITTINYVFFDVNDTNDRVYLNLTFTTGILGIADKSTSKAIGLSFYPNPSDNILNVSLNSTSNSIKEIKITNILGSVVKTQSLGKLENAVAIKTEDLEDGVYFVSVISNGKIDNSKRVIIKH